MQEKRRTWTRTIERAKRAYWKLFLDGEGKLWKAAAYMKPRGNWGCVPSLQVDSNELTENEDKAEAFRDTFFPKMNDPDEDPPVHAPPELQCRPFLPSISGNTELLFQTLVTCCNNPNMESR
jgi:hypothetical protein